MERPSTSKPRGTCRYYNTPRGCFAGKSCKFLHGEDRLTRFDQSKICRFYQAGYCRKGTACWFLHPGESEEDHLCSICYEKPVTYALLAGCSHVFCIECIRKWRKSANKDQEIVTAETAKSCPYCRASSDFVTPSSQFFPEGHPRKAEAITNYKESMARVPCKYFANSPPKKRHCPFGQECFYQHQNDDGTPFVFIGGIQENMHARRNPFTWPPITDFEDIHQTLLALRRNLPALLGLNGAGENELDPTETERMLTLAEEMLRDLNSIALRGAASSSTTPEPPTPTMQFEVLFPEEPTAEVETEEPVPEPASVAVVVDEETEIITQQAEQSTSSVVAEAFGDDAPNPVYHNPNPPFATDGRGRVVWSNRSGREASQRPSLSRKATEGGEE